MVQWCICWTQLLAAKYATGYGASGREGWGEG